LVSLDQPVGDGSPTIISSNGITRFIFPRPGAGLSEKEPRSKDTHDPYSSFGVIYVNALGRAAMLAAKPSVFPAGSIIVREKLARLDDKQPELVAAMVKRASGFSPKTGDWEYLILSGDLKKIRQRQKKGACLGCHESQRSRDFVFPANFVKPR
jgi:hypothetical protein